MADNILQTIAEYTKERIAEAKRSVSPEEMRTRAMDAVQEQQERAAHAQKEEIPRAAEKKAACTIREAFAFEKALRGPDIGFICECKKASPSKGLIAPDFPYLEIAGAYEEAGAACISVLTEPKWFLGSNAYLREIAAQVGIPCIRKDFTVDEYMIWEAKTLGADAVLLICSLLSKQQLREYREICDELGLSALVEAHDEEEITAAVEAGARIIGVNNRNLKDFRVDVHNSERLRRLVPPQILFVAESGIKSAQDIEVLRRANVNGVLIGETLMRAPDKRAMLDQLRGIC